MPGKTSIGSVPGTTAGRDLEREPSISLPRDLSCGLSSRARQPLDVMSESPSTYKPAALVRLTRNRSRWRW